MNYAVRITLPFEDCKDIVSRWADRCSKAIAFEHIADEEVSKTHIHLAMYGCEVKAEQMKRMWIDCPGKGNEFWSWKDLQPIDSFGGEDEDRSCKYITYMSKGTLRPVFVKNISNDLVEKSRQSWVEPVKADKTGDYSDRIIKKIMMKFDLKKQSIYFRDDDDMITLGKCKYNLELLLSNVRSESFRQLWGEQRKVPQPTHYKIIASTVFLRICEDEGCFEEGSGLIRNLWY